MNRDEARDALLDDLAGPDPAHACSGCGDAVPCRRCPDDTPTVLERQIRAKVLREAADRWQRGQWADALQGMQGGPASTIGAAMRVTDWLRGLADEEPHA